MLITKNDLYVYLLQNVHNASRNLEDRSHIYAGPVKISITKPTDSFNGYQDIIAELKVEYFGKKHTSLLHVLINNTIDLEKLTAHINSIVEGAIKDVQSI